MATMRMTMRTALFLAAAALSGCKTLNDGAPLKGGPDEPAAGGAGGEAAAQGTTSTTGGDCTAGWEQFSHKPYEQIALPDTNVRYWRYRYKQGDRPVFLRVTGERAKARYMNFNLYDAQTQDSGASLPDVSIKPMASEGADARRYHVWVGTGAQQNALEIPAESSGIFELWYRIYVPEGGDDKGGVPLPTIQAFADQAGATPTACPEAAKVEPNILNALDAFPPENPLGTFWMYRVRATGLYANLDNVYLGSRARLVGGNVVIMRFKAPKTPDDVRYWSICIGGLDQKTSSCMRDSEMKVKNGFVTVVIGPEDLRATAQSRGQNFMTWGSQLFQVVIYRNLLTNPDFAGNMNQVKRVEDGLFEASSYGAHNFIGDYAPRGRKCIRLTYKANNCGIPQ